MTKLKDLNHAGSSSNTFFADLSSAFPFTLGLSSFSNLFHQDQL